MVLLSWSLHRRSVTRSVLSTRAWQDSSIDLPTARRCTDCAGRISSRARSQITLSVKNGWTNKEKNLVICVLILKDMFERIWIHRMKNVLRIKSQIYAYKIQNRLKWKIQFPISIRKPKNILRFRVEIKSKRYSSGIFIARSYIFSELWVERMLRIIYIHFARHRVYMHNVHDNG